jgi:type IV pilus assembly protein PilC
VLISLTETLKWEDEIASQTRKLMMYPLIVGTIVLAVAFFLMLYIVPQMVGFIRNMGQTIPWYTQALIFVSDTLRIYWWAVLAAPFAAWYALRFAMRTNPAVEYAVDSYKLRMLLIGPILRKLLLSRFASSFGMMYSAGITVLDAIRSCEEIVGNKVLEHALRAAGQQIGEGKNLSTAFQELELFPPLVIRMLRIGENTGALDKALANVTYFYNREVRDGVARLQAAIQPVLTVVLGVLLLWVMMAVLGPVYDSFTKMKF